MSLAIGSIWLMRQFLFKFTHPTFCRNASTSMPSARTRKYSETLSLDSANVIFIPPSDCCLHIKIQLLACPVARYYLSGFFCLWQWSFLKALILDLLSGIRSVSTYIFVLWHQDSLLINTIKSDFRRYNHLESQLFHAGPGMQKSATGSESKRITLAMIARDCWCVFVFDFTWFYGAGLCISNRNH